MSEITHTVVEKNLHLLDKGDDYWVGQRITLSGLADQNLEARLGPFGLEFL